MKRGLYVGLVVATLAAACTGSSGEGESDPESSVASVTALRVKDVSSDAVVLTWRLTEGDADTVTIARGEEEVATLSAEEARFEDSTAAPGTKYVYSLTVVAASGSSGPATVGIRTPVPPIGEARLQGSFEPVRFVLVESTIGGPQTAGPSGHWTFKPQCKKGPCDVLMKSVSGGYSLRLAYLSPKGRYGGLTVRSNYWECGSVPEDVRAEVDLQVKDARVVNEVWVATEIGGTVEYTDLENNSCLPGFEKVSFSARLSKK